MYMLGSHFSATEIWSKKFNVKLFTKLFTFSLVFRIRQFSKYITIIERVLAYLPTYSKVRNSPLFMESKGSVPCTQEFVTRPYSEPSVFSLHLHTVSKINFTVLFLSMHRLPKWPLPWFPT